MKRVLIVDAQVFQTPAWHRGMGKYSMELLAAINTQCKANRIWDSIEIIISSKLSVEPDVLDNISKKIDNAKIVKLGLERDEITNAQIIMNRNRNTIDNYVDIILKKYKKAKIDFFILSPMQGGVCSVFPTNIFVHKSLIFYDLIPFMFHEIYFKNKIAEIESLTKLTELLKADTYLSISKTAANDLSVYLGVDPIRIKNINGGAIKHSTISQAIPIKKPFILMPTGNELRKNNRTGILGFNEFNKKHNQDYTLVITSSFDPDQVSELSKLSDCVLFTGNISGEELNYLYEECDILLFPSYYEGLGLPVLEAVEKNKPVACSNISVFREISDSAFHFFDPSQGISISNALNSATEGKVDTRAYKNILNRYTWKATADEAINAISESLNSYTKAKIKQKISIFAHSPKCDTQIAKTAQRLHAEISRKYDATYFLSSNNGSDSPRPDMLSFVSPAHDISKNSPIDIVDNEIVIYHIDNSPISSKTLFSALANPGVAILYDLDLTNMWSSMKEDCKIISESRYDAECLLNDKYYTKDAKMLVSLIASQKAIIVFSEEYQKTIELIAKKMKVKVIVFCAKFPVSSLVYDDIIPRKEDTIAALDFNGNVYTDSFTGKIDKNNSNHNHTSDVGIENIKSKEVVLDREFEDLLSFASFSFCNDNKSCMFSIEASRYGTIPLYSETYINMPYPKTGINNTKVIKVPDINLYDTRVEVIKNISHDYSYRSFIEVLEGLINKISLERKK